MSTATSETGTESRSCARSGTNSYGGWKSAWGCNYRALSVYRITLASLLLVELCLRCRFLRAFYSDQGTLPLHLLLPKVDPIYQTVCVHCYSGSLFYQQVLLFIQIACAWCLLVGYRTRSVAVSSWFLYLSLTLRNTWLNFILDRYFHYLLFYAMFLPLGRMYGVDSYRDKKKKEKMKMDANTPRDETDASSPFFPNGYDFNKTTVNAATIALKLQIAWIYLDAGGGKFLDPMGGWSYNAHPLPALDTYARHTVAARYIYALLQPFGLRLLTPAVVCIELFAAPIALSGSFLGARRSVHLAIGLICSLHVGIALCIRNAVLLSLVACCAWCVYLPPPPPPLHVTMTTAAVTITDDDATRTSSRSSSSSNDSDRVKTDDQKNDGPTTTRQGGEDNNFGDEGHGNKRSRMISTLLIAAFISASIWFETTSDTCDQSVKHIWSTLLHNRWNVFVGAEAYVTWEIAPGRLADGSIVDVWAQTDSVNWDMPGSGAPCTSTSRPGRWRSFPYLAGLDGEDGEALWGYLCRQWDADNDVTTTGNAGRKLLRFNFFMLQADVLPNMGFSATRKRLIHSHVCHVSENGSFLENEDTDTIEEMEKGGDDGQNDEPKGQDSKEGKRMDEL